MKYLVAIGLTVLLSGCATFSMRSQDEVWGKCPACGKYQRSVGVTGRVAAGNKHLWTQQMVCPDNHYYLRDVTSPVVGRARPGYVAPQPAPEPVPEAAEEPHGE